MFSRILNHRAAPFVSAGGFLMGVGLILVGVFQGHSVSLILGLTISGCVVTGGSLSFGGCVIAEKIHRYYENKKRRALRDANPIRFVSPPFPNFPRHDWRSDSIN